MKHSTDKTETSESEAIRSEIKHTREHMDETLDQIGEHMKPRRFFDDVLNFFRGSEPGRSPAGKVASSVVGVVREHPIPTLLIGAGIAWAIYEKRHRNGHHGNGHSYREERRPRDWSESDEQYELEHMESYSTPSGPSTKEKLKEKFSAAGEQLKEKGTQLKEKVAESSRAVGQKASELSSKVGQGVKRGYQVSRDKFVQVSDENPLCVGAGFLAAGLLTGLALPSSRKEDEWVGKASDRLKQRARAKGQELMQRGKEVASAGTEAARKSAEEKGLSFSSTQKSGGGQSSQSGSQTAQPQSYQPAGGSTPAQPSPYQ